jgi:hypothetical protein
MLHLPQLFIVGAFLFALSVLEGSLPVLEVDLLDFDLCLDALDLLLACE